MRHKICCNQICQISIRGALWTALRIFFFYLCGARKKKTKCHSCHIPGHQTGIRHGLSRGCHQRLSVILSIIGKTLRVINNFLTRRWMFVAISKVKSLEHKVKRGDPQGSFLSPALFNAVLVQLPRWLSPNICCSIYARDICSLTSGQTLKIIEIALKVAFNQVNEFLQEGGTSLCPENQLHGLPFTLKRHKNSNIWLDGHQ